MPDDFAGAWDDLAPPDDEPSSHVEPRGEGVIPLGHDRGHFFYFSVSAGQVWDLTPGQHTQAMLCGMASPAHYWERSVWFSETKGVRWEAAAAALMAMCREVGIYDPDRLRGRGAWLDHGRVVLHAGDRLIVDGHDTGSLTIDGSDHIYEHARRLKIRIAVDPLSNREASRLMDLCCSLDWEEPQSMGRLLAGWVVIAPVCGAMIWRPHLWLSAEGASGKTWVADNIIRPLLNETALRVQSKTTDAFIRQSLGSDARPVLFDEFEAEDDQGRRRIQAVLDLARQASSEDAAPIGKGGHNGQPMSYHVRSVFFLSSINLNLGRQADESRTVILTLIPKTDNVARAAAFDRLKALHAEIMTPTFPAGLLARTLRLLPVIRENSEVFAQAIARAGQSRRLGDTIGVLLAGAWSLRSTRAASPLEADAFIAGTPWVQEAMTRAETIPEWQRAIAFLVQQPLRIVPSNNRPEDVPIGELLVLAAGMPADARSVAMDDAIRGLARAGIRVSYEGTDARVYVANTSEALGEMFAKRSWGAGWLATIARAPGAEKVGKTVAFGKHRSRALSLPLGHFVGEGEG